MKQLLILAVLFPCLLTFTFLYPFVTPSTLTINTQGSYQLYAMRNYDTNLNPTPYATELVPPGSNITVIFPSQYQLTSPVPTVTALTINQQSMLSFTQAVIANNVTILNAVTTNLAIANVSIVIDNILNPYPAFTTDPFIVIIGSDISASSTSSAITLSPAEFKACSITFSPSTVNTTSNMIVSVTPANLLKSKDQIVVTFPVSLQWSQDISTSHTLPIGAALTCNPITGEVTSAECFGQTTTAQVTYSMTGIAGNQTNSSLSFSIGPLFSPPTTSPPDTLTLTSYSSTGYQIDTCTTRISGLSPQSMSLSLSSSSSPLYVNSGTSLVLTFTLADTISRSDYFQLVLPAGSTFSFVAISTINLSIFSSSVAYISSNQTIVMRQAISSPTRFAGTTCTITIGRYVSPPSTLTTSPFLLQLYDISNGLKMQGSATLTAVAKPYTLRVEPSSYFINKNASYTFTLTTQDRMLASGMLSIKIPAQLTSFIAASCIVNANFSSPGTPNCTLSSGQLTIRNLSTSEIAPATYAFTVGSILNTDRALTTSNFSLVAYYSNNLLAKVGESNVLGITLLPVKITNISVQLSDYTVSSTGTTITVSFTALNPVAINGYLTLKVPQEIGIVSNYIPQCILSVQANSTIPACSLNNRTFTLPLSTYQILAGQTIIVTLSGVGVNPATTKPTSPIQLYTYSVNNFMVDYSNDTAVIDNFQPMDLSSAAVTPSNLTNSAQNIYTIRVSQTTSWNSNSFLQVHLPSTVTIPSNSSLNCFNATSNDSINCTAGVDQPQVITISLLNSATTATLTIQSLINPVSLKPSDSFTLTTLSDEGYAYATSKLVRVTTTDPSSFALSSFSFSSLTFDTFSNLTLTLVHRSNSNQIVLLNFKQFASKTTNLTCKESTIELSCRIEGTSLVVNPLNTTNYFATQTTLQIHDLYIPSSTNLTSMTAFSYQDGYLVSSFGPISWASNCTIPCLTCLANSSSTCLSCFNSTSLTTAIYLHQNQCLSACPNSTYTSENQCLACKSPCAECSITETRCTQCNQSSSTPFLDISSSTCLSSCSNGTFPNLSNNLTSYTSICSACQSPCSTCISASQCLTCSNTSLFLHEFQCLTSCPANVTIANVTSRTCQKCIQECLTCVNTTTTCLSCNFSVASFYVASTFSCVSKCPDGLVPDNNTCVGCQSPCSTCSGTKNNCTSCLRSTNTYLSAVTIGACLASCQKYYYPNVSSLICQACQAVPSLFCKNCYNSTYCLSCDTGYVLFLANNSCLDYVPPGYVNLTGIAAVCSNNCSECAGSIDNCTACVGEFSLYVFHGGGSCQTSCPQGTLSLNNSCIGCLYPCLDCWGELGNCTSCITGYLYANACPSNCPNGTFINSSAVACQSCSSPCRQCIATSTTCTSCLSGYLYNFSCLSSCPISTTPYNNTCYPCISPCKTCQIQTDNCTSCVGFYYFYTSNNRCYSSCPTGVSIPSNTSGFLNCLPCNTNCSSCDITVSNCTSCIQGLSLYNYTCSNSCPDGFYSLGRVCTPCAGNCFTCAGTSTSCLSCSGAFKLFGSNCVTTCPVTHSIVTNNTCIACSNGCLNCSAGNFCYNCPSSTALYEGACVSSCPSPLILHYNSSSQELGCFTQSQLDIQTNNQTLTSSLQINSILPLPFTIISSFFFLCCLMSKLQNPDTYTTGIGYSLYGCAEAGAISYVLAIFLRNYSPLAEFNLYSTLLWVCVGTLIALNAISAVMITICLCSDVEFDNWLNNRPRGTLKGENSQVTGSESLETGASKANQSVECCGNNGSFAVWTIICLLVSYKIRLIMFTKLFRFRCLSAQLDNIQGFRLFNVMSYLGIFYQGIYCFVAFKLLSVLSFSNDKEILLASIDALVLVIISFILALVSTHKDEDFFRSTFDKKVIDLGRRKHKKDPKNFKIAPMDSRDKLVNINQSLSSIEDAEEIIVNHNIDSNISPKKVTAGWVPKSPPQRSQSHRNPHQNIFDVDRDNDDNSPYLPFQTRDHLSPRQRIQLFHTSVRPKQPNESRSNLWVPIESSSALKQAQKVSGTKLILKKDVQIQSHIQLEHIDLQARQQQVQSKPTKKINSPQAMNNQEISRKTYQPRQFVIEYQPQSLRLAANLPPAVIMETQSENFNTSGRKSKAAKGSIKGNIFERDELLTSEKDVTADDLNKTVEEVESKEKSYESVLPFVHEDGVLKDKKKQGETRSKQDKQELAKQTKQPEYTSVKHNPWTKESKVANMAAVANRYITQDYKIQKHSKEPLEQLLEISQIQEKAQEIQINPTKQIHKHKPHIGLASSQLTQVILPHPKSLPTASPPSTTAFPSKPLKNNLTFTQQLSQLVEPQPMQPLQQNVAQPSAYAAVPVMHVPKTFSRANIIAAELPEIEQMQEFDKKMQKKEAELAKLKTALLKGSQAVQEQYLRSEKVKRGRSRKSMAGEGTLFEKRSRDQLVVERNENENDPSKYSEWQLQEVQLQQGQEKTSSHPVDEKLQESRSGNRLSRNIFDQEVYTEEDYPAEKTATNYRLSNNDEPEANNQSQKQKQQEQLSSELENDKINTNEIIQSSRAQERSVSQHQKSGFINKIPTIRKESGENQGRIVHQIQEEKTHMEEGIESNQKNSQQNSNQDSPPIQIIQQQKIQSSSQPIVENSPAINPPNHYETYPLHCRVENDSKEDYHQESDRSSGQDQPSPPFVEETYSPSQPQYVLQEQSGNLEEHSRQETVQIQNQKQKALQTHNVTANSIRKTSKTKKKLPTPPQELAIQYESPFRFEVSARPIEQPQDEETAIQSRIQRHLPSNPLTKEAGKNQDQVSPHSEVINLLNRAQRASRSRKKIPKDQKDERIAIKIDSSHLKQKPVQREDNIVRKSMEKNRPIGNFTLKQAQQDYSEESQSEPHNNYRKTENRLIENKTTSQITKPPQRPSRLIEHSQPASAFSLYEKQTEIPEMVLNFPKREKTNEIREFNFGEEVSSLSAPSSEAELVRWRERFTGAPQSGVQPSYEQNRIPAQPFVHKVTQMEQYYEEQGEVRERRKGRKRSKKRKHVSNRKSQLEKIYRM